MRRLTVEAVIRLRGQLDEVAAGHVGRLSQMNDYPNGRSFLDGCKKMYARRLEREQWFSRKFLHLKVLAMLGRQSLEEYAAAHAMIESFPKSPMEWYSGDETRYYGLATQRVFAYLCEDCVLVDTIALGFAHWHRSHQLIGRECCAMHPFSRLLRVDQPRPFDRSPAHWLKGGLVIADPIIEDRDYQAWRAFLVEYEQASLDNPLDRSLGLELPCDVHRMLPDMLMYEMGRGKRWEEEKRPERKGWWSPWYGPWKAGNYATKMTSGLFDDMRRPIMHDADESQVIDDAPRP